MFRRFACDSFSRKSRKRQRPRNVGRLVFESLEDRRMLATYTVDTLDDVSDGTDGLTSLREAIALTNGTGQSDAIDFSVSGSINLGSQLPDITETLSINGNNQITIDAGGLLRIFNITAASGDFALKGLALHNGFTTESGGAVRIANGDLVVEDSVISGSMATTRWGGGIYAEANADISLIRSTVSGNTADWGGGILGYGRIEVVDSTISDNVATVAGGGIYGNDTIIVSNSTISGNSADYGGGIYNRGTATITNSTLSGNSAQYYGGGIYNEGTATITNSTLSGNSAQYGGGVYSSTTATISNSTLSGNSAQYGGGVYNSGTATITSSTLSGNSASVGGGGIYNAATATVTNSIVANSPQGGDIAGSGFSGSHNLIGDGSDLSSFTNSISGDPMLGPLADNGGPTMTHALLPGSPAIDAGDNALAVDTAGSALLTDQRGSGFNRIFSGTVDIGAFEFEPSAFLLGDVNQDGVIDFSDIAPFISVLQSGTFIDEADINGDGVVDFNDISFFIDLLIAQ